MRVTLSGMDGAFDVAMKDFKKPMASAATDAMRDIADFAVREGRQDIASAGFGKVWQEGYVATVYPTGQKQSLKAMTVLRHKIGLASVFEFGANISGNPLIFLPLPAAPSGVKGRPHMTPRQYRRQVGPLRSVNRPGKAPLLVGKARRGTGPDIPLYVGVSAVRIRKRFHLQDVAKRAAAKFEQFYSKHLKD